NPGNNLHVSNISHKINLSDLETALPKLAGYVVALVGHIALVIQFLLFRRFKRHPHTKKS
ncbi:hypothetical protein GYMLUDRAFT_170327, partial [Collybiopsis luxurians FD-317 M1]